MKMSFTNQFFKSVSASDSELKSAIAEFFSDPGIKIAPFNDREYLEGLIAFCSQSNDIEKVIEATLQSIEEKSLRKSILASLASVAATDFLSNRLSKSCWNRNSLSISLE